MTSFHIYEGPFSAVIMSFPKSHSNLQTRIISRSRYHKLNYQANLINWGNKFNRKCGFEALNGIRLLTQLKLRL